MDTDAAKREREEREYKDYLNRMKRTLNTKIQENIFPHWRAHTSLLGWSSMNYPSILGNKKNLLHPQTNPKDSASPSKFSNLSRPITSQPEHAVRPISTEAEVRAVKMSVDPTFTDSLINKVGKQHALQTIKEYRDVIEENKRLKSAQKFSAGTLSTYTYEEKKQVIEQLNQKSENYAPLKPAASVLGPKVDPLNCRKVKQLDDIEFEDDESNEDEDTYQYKVFLSISLILYRDYQNQI